jgi:hypothetical protein
MSRQQRLIKIGAYFFNGAFREIPDTLKDYPIWNHRFSAELEFRSSAVNKALSGFERGNVSGYRVLFTADLRNTYTTDVADLRVLFSLFASESRRIIQTLTPTSANSTTIVLPSGASSANGYYNGTYLVQGSLKTRVVSYVGSTRTATVEGDTLTTASTDVVLFPDKPTILGISKDTNANNIIYYNMTNSAIALARELTVGSQSISLQARSIERFSEIPQSLIL